MNVPSKLLLLVSISVLAFATPEANAGRKKAPSAMKVKPGVLPAPVLSPAEKAPTPVEKSKAPAANPCSMLTPAAIQHAVDEIDDAIADAQANLVAHNPAAYAPAGEYAVDYFKNARGKMVALQVWLADNHLDSPFVSNASASYSIHWIARDAAGILAYGEHWAGISAVYNTSTEARNAAEHGARATDLLADIGADGMRCYMQAYFP